MKRVQWIILASVLLLIPTIMILGCGGEKPTPRDNPRALSLPSNAVCYGPHRDGQRPGGPAPSEEQLLEDLRLMEPLWNAIRLYGSGDVAESILALIRQYDLDLKVMLGIWIATDAEAANDEQVDGGIRLANKYPNIVAAVCVGNETQVSWSPNPSPLDDLIGHVRRVRAAIKQPVTGADDFAYWLEDRSLRLAAELDFITMYYHPLWNGKQLEEGLHWVQTVMNAVQEKHPQSKLVLGETGWATSAHNEGDQSRRIKGQPGEAEQKIFYDEICSWSDSSGQIVFWFEAFDENWKGGTHPDEVEKHWGLFRADRTKKAALAR